MADIVNEEYSTHPICLRPGRQKKFFASAITPGGIVNYLRSLLNNIEKVYLISVPEGFSNHSFMEIIKEGAVYRGYDTEIFYCPMGPEEKIEHLVIPQLKIAFITVNEYHDLEPWELFDEEEDVNYEREKELTLIDVSDYMRQHIIEENALLMAELKEEYEILLGRTIKALEWARNAHQRVENMYIPNMNFTRISAFSEELFEELSKI